MRVSRTATVAFDEFCCIGTDYHSAGVPAKVLNAPLNLVVSDAVAFAVKSQLENGFRAFLHISVLLRLSISTAGHLLLRRD